MSLFPLRKCVANDQINEIEGLTEMQSVKKAQTKQAKDFIRFKQAIIIDSCHESSYLSL